MNRHRPPKGESKFAKTVQTIHAGIMAEDYVLNSNNRFHGIAHHIGTALQGRRSNGAGWLVRCPCPNHGKGRGDRSPSLSVTDGDDGRLLLRCFAGCEFTDILSELKHRGLVEGPLKLSPRPVARPSSPPVKIKEPDPVALEIWQASEAIAETIAQNYLERRGIRLLPPRLRFYQGAMIAGVEQPHRDITAIQKTPLTPDGERRDGERWTKGDLGNGAVRLGAAQEIMGLAEGTETALSAMTLTGMSVWASLGAGRLHNVELPPLVRTVHIFADNDDPGRTAADRTAKAHQALGRHVWIHWPPDGANDFNDFVILHADRWAEIEI
jgi:putative DNA primase/helicase